MHSKLNPHRDYLLGLIRAEPDVTIAEMQARLASEAGVSASVCTPRWPGCVEGP